MNTTTLSLTPLLRQSIGFDRFNDLFESVLRSDQSDNTFPPFNIEKRGEDDYTITMALAGYRENDLSIVVENSQLVVSARPDDSEDDAAEYLHHGIVTKAFERTFRLADYMQVTGAEINNGLLSIKLVREIPDEAKPRSIPIGIAGKNGSKKSKALKGRSQKVVN